MGGYFAFPFIFEKCQIMSKYANLRHFCGHRGVTHLNGIIRWKNDDSDQ